MKVLEVAYNVADGTVVSVVKNVTAINNCNYGYGNYIILEHEDGITTLYAHMSSIKVSNGQKVSKGQVVGYEGTTGYSTGPHCHFEVRVNGQPNNPLNYIGI